MRRPDALHVAGAVTLFLLAIASGYVALRVAVWLVTLAVGVFK